MVNFPGGLAVNAVIFDFDGVIVDTEPIHYQAFQKVLGPLHLGFTWQEYVDTYMGFDDRDAFVEAFSVKGKPIASSELHELIAKKANIFQDIIRNGISPYPGAKHLIDKLHRNQVPLAISSGALRSDIMPILDQLGIAHCFNIIISADDVSKSKPDPECYRIAYEKLRSSNPQPAILQDSTLAIEDTPAGIEAALSAGLRVVAIANSYPRVNLSRANIIIESLEELLDFCILP